jgi:hypothetical protein
MGAVWINRYMVAMAIGLGAAAGMAGLHGDLFVLLFPVVVCLVMVAGGVVDSRLHARDRGRLR